MRIVTQPPEMQALAQELRRAGRRIGLVPTMGYLHAGHLSLVRLARARADTVIVSLFVNPTQFGPREDLVAYPRDLPRDEALCRAAGVDVLFCPAAEQVYAAGHSVYVTEDDLSRGLCGATRPGHFRGVATIVAKLFNLVLPHVAVFGEKDAQQLRVIRRMTRDLDFPVEIVAGPTIRESDGLAMSSRNAMLNAEERRQAVCLRRALDAAAGRLRAGERRADALCAAMRAEIDRAPLARVDYLAVVDDETLAPVVVVERPVLVALAVFMGRTRLIDNAMLSPGAP